MRERWVPVGLLALAIFVVNAASRFITWKGDVVAETEQLTIGLIAVSMVALLLAVVSARWALRHPFPRLLADVSAAVGVGASLSLVVGPFFGGSTPFAEGLGSFVGQVLMFVGIAAVGVLLGFLSMVALGKDVRSRRLRQYAQRQGRRIVRG